MTQMTTEPVTRTALFDCDRPAEIDIRIGIGRVEVRAADTADVRVEVAADPTGEWVPEVAAQAIAATDVSWSEHGRRLSVRAPRGFPFRKLPLAIVVVAPLSSRLAVRATSATLTATGALGRLDVRTHSGEMTVERVEGNAEVRSGSGDVRLGRVAGHLKLAIGAGHLEVSSLDGKLNPGKITAGSADVWLGVVHGNIGVRTGSGAIVVAEAASGRIDAATGSGDVRIGIRPGVTAEVDLVSGSGRAHSDLPVTGGRPPEQPQLRVHARTGSGAAVATTAS